MKMNTFLVFLLVMIITFGSYFLHMIGIPIILVLIIVFIASLILWCVNTRDTQDTAKDVGKNISDQIQLRDPEHGTWDPSVHYITDDQRNGYAQEISVDVKDYQYQRDQEIAKINFDFSVDLKQVPRGSTLTIDGAPFTIENGKLTEFTINQTGLNHSGEVMVSAKPNTTRFVVMVNTEGVQKAYVTDGSEGSVRFWGYIVYK